MEKNELKSLLLDQSDVLNSRPIGFIRESLKKIEASLKLKHTIVITGPRRCGKSTLLIQIMRKCLQPQEYYYCNFDDERLINFTVKDFNLLYEVSIELFGNRRIFIFDEIQNITGWERFVNRMQESGNKCILTGSNSNLLSTELATHLTGRHIDFQLLPFSFREFLLTQDVSVEENDFFKTSKRARLNNLFEEYLLTGGYPEYVQEKDPQILQQLFKDIITKDIILRHKVQEIQAMREMALYLISNVTSLISNNKLRAKFGFGSSHTVKNYLDYFQEVYLLFQLPMFSYSVHKQQVNRRKIYTIDNGLVKANSFAFSENLGNALENLVFTELKRSEKECYYYTNKHECDFLIKDKEKITSAIQVTVRIDEKNEKREIKGLLEAIHDFKLKTGTIITLDQKQALTIDNIPISVIPANEWLLAQSP